MKKILKNLLLWGGIATFLIGIIFVLARNEIITPGTFYSNVPGMAPKPSIAPADAMTPQENENTPWGFPTGPYASYIKTDAGSSAGYCRETRGPMWVSTIPNKGTPSNILTADKQLKSPAPVSKNGFVLSQLSPYATTTASAVLMSLQAIQAFGAWMDSRMTADAIYAGPIFGNSPIAIDNIPIPDAIYAIAVTDNKIETVVFHPNIPTGPIKTIPTKIETLSKLTGITFFHHPSP